MSETLSVRCKNLLRFYGKRTQFTLGFRRPRKHLKVWLRGFCNICGNSAEFWVEASPNFRESLHCGVCGSSARNRMLASGLLLVASTPPCQSIAEFSRRPNGPRILDTDCYSPIFQLLRRSSFYRSTIYAPRKQFGTNVFAKVNNVDLQAMPFESESFDIVLTSDVMEHVRRDDLAHSEILRCLKPSGYYVFTVPFVPGWQKNQIRINSSGAEDIYLMEKEYHGDPATGNGILVYRIYGNELIEHLTSLGFKVQFDDQPDAQRGMLSKDLFICRKIA